MLIDKPTDIERARPDGSPLKPINEVLLERRATNNFTDEEVSAEVLDAVLRLGAQAPSGYNFQPWRFVVVRDAESRRRLQQVAFNQPKVAQAPVVIIAVGMKEEWKETADEVFREGSRRGAGNPDKVEQASRAPSSSSPAWTRPCGSTPHVIAVTAMMLVAESYGYDTAPMEGFDAAGVKREFAIPEEGESSACSPSAAPPSRTSPTRAASRWSASSSPSGSARRGEINEQRSFRQKYGNSGCPPGFADGQAGAASRVSGACRGAARPLRGAARPHGTCPRLSHPPRSPRLNSLTAARKEPAEALARLADSQARTDAKMAETDERLNILVNPVERTSARGAMAAATVRRAAVVSGTAQDITAMTARFSRRRRRATLSYGGCHAGR